MAPEFAPGFRRLRAARLTRRKFVARDVRGACFVVAATDDPGVNRSVARACAAKGILVNVVDRPELSTAIVPAVLRRGLVTISVGTDGAAPALSKALRRDLARALPREIGAVARALGEARRRVQRAVTDPQLRWAGLKRLARATPAAILRGRGFSAVRRRIRRATAAILARHG